MPVVPRLGRGALHRRRRARGEHEPPVELHAIREAIKPWAERLRDRRFETEGEWKLKLAGGTRGTVEVLTRELRDALR